MSFILKRIKEIADQEGISVTALEASIGASKGVFSRALANSTDIQSKWLVKIAENYPQYSPDWLITGKGESKRTDVCQEPLEDYLPQETVKLTNEVIQALKKVISAQQTTIRSQEITIDALQKRIGDMENEK
ncbi:hypothetical protein [Olivibacter domesticus]|uniref:HTH cro/C1-type domain-containing protein n=1 Tax=Olivibacter domesticus TaxID=407022 RepID=A0A1H7XE16_OLID1|nr:hypothetical protein [Olivibacter domesticus]SEM31923.1 hypothetical protein SAMN05661044_04853 [Olivibacter domesticus]